MLSGMPALLKKKKKDLGRAPFLSLRIVRVYCLFHTTEEILKVSEILSDSWVLWALLTPADRNDAQETDGLRSYCQAPWARVKLECFFP